MGAGARSWGLGERGAPGGHESAAWVPPLPGRRAATVGGSGAGTSPPPRSATGPLRDLGTLESCYLPSGCPPDLSGFTEESTHEGWGGRVTVRTFHPTPEGLRLLAGVLRAAQRAAAGISVPERLAVLDAVAARFLEGDDELGAAIAAVTGFSPPMVAHALWLEQASSRAPHLQRALVRELGSVDVLDGWVEDPLLGGRSRAFGPELVGAVCSANIPGLPHLEVMRALLVKGACLAKVSRGEPLFLAAWVRALEAVSPDLAATVAVIALDREDSAARAAFVGAVDHLVAYGGASAIATLQAEARERARVEDLARLPLGTTWHGHRLGLALVARECLEPGGLADLADRVAYDFSLYDQEACLSPAVLYAEEGGAASPRDLAAALAEAMERWAERLPPRRLGVDGAAARRRWLDWRRMAGADVVAAPAGLPFVVVLDGDPAFGPNAPGRLVRVVSVPDLGEALARLSGHRAWLQCAALAASPERQSHLGGELARLGATRLTRPGLMGLPSMMWRHDGLPCLGSLVRFCDEEVLAPADNLSSP